MGTKTFPFHSETYHTEVTRAQVMLLGCDVKKQNERICTSSNHTVRTFRNNYILTMRNTSSSQ